MGGGRYAPGGPPRPAPRLSKSSLKRSRGGGPLRAGGGVRENRRLGRTIETCSLAPSNCASCIFAIARSASSISSYMMYAVPRLTLKVGFMGMRRSLMTPYLPKISRTWSSLTFLVSASTTICWWISFTHGLFNCISYLCASGRGRAVFW
jgi:hypothetical protein